MSETPSSTAPARDARPRRTQEARSAETQARLLDATIASLVEVGYANTTTTAVCERAGVSRGAQVHHFPRKQDLVVAAVAHLAARRATELRRRAEALPAASGAARLAALLDLVTEAFGGPLFDAALELWVAARTDAELHRSLLLFERVAGRGLASLWREVAGDLADHERFDALLQLTMHMARGMALQKILRSDDTARRRLLGVWREMATQALRG
ncbi:MAG: helix-turn-helix domain containing protein [Proteobacteria bacterium]|nr:helix-turn-helix domain containing protein [Pseudomonadota bacterium]